MSSLALFSFPTSKELFSHLVGEDLCSFSWGFPLNLFMDQAAVAAKSLQSCVTPCNPIDGSPPGSPVPGILQARTLEWVAISFSNAWKWKVKVKSLSRVRLFATPWTVAYYPPLSMGFSRQEYWSGVPSPSPVETMTTVQNTLCQGDPPRRSRSIARMRAETGLSFPQ